MTVLVIMLCAVIVAAIAVVFATRLALAARNDQLAARRETCEARTRAALAESALHDIRHRRSQATATGNRTRAAKQSAIKAAKCEEIRAAVALKRAGGQHSLPLSPADAAGGYIAPPFAGTDDPARGAA